MVERLGHAYDEAHHRLHAAGHATVLPDGFLDRFTVVGPAEHCAQRLRELVERGLERIITVPASHAADPALVAAPNRRFTDEILSRLRG